MAAGAIVIGISPDPIKKQAKFAQNYELPFPMLSDEDHDVAELYGVWQEKSFMGRKYMGIKRTTFLIDKSGIIREVFEKIVVKNHPQQVLDAVRAF